MGKKDKTNNLGKALIRNRFNSSNARKNRGDVSMLHSENINDGYDWACLNLQSVTEESSFQEFLSTAELAGTEFHAEKLNINFINSRNIPGLLSNDEKTMILEAQKQNRGFLKIPRRPKWDKNTTSIALQTKEKEDFLQWRRQLATLQEAESIILTPYEKNLELWRQLWRVVDRSDVIVQIVDARNPLLFRCEDLENYVKEVDPMKMNMILINKADFLTDHQRQLWAEYFTSINVQVAFFSAKLANENEKLKKVSEKEDTENKKEDVEGEKEEEEEEKKEKEEKTANLIDKSRNLNVDRRKEEDNEMYNSVETNENDQTATKKETYNDNKLKDDNMIIGPQCKHTETETINNSPELLTRDKLVTLFKSIYKNVTFMKGVMTIGLVGYPNVGKSSTINALLQYKKVAVSATPGKTKHFQTLYVDKDLLLCDCPGLVMPSFVNTKAEMILNGILPIDQMRDHVPSMNLLGSLIPRHVIEDLYGIMLPAPREGEDSDRPPTSEEILNAYGYNRGFMTQNGQPDNPRSARYLLKDFVNGKLLYCVAPPTQNQNEFHTFPSRRKIISENTHIPARMMRVNAGKNITSEELDRVFIQQQSSSAHVRGVSGKVHGVPTTASAAEFIAGSLQSLNVNEKPWKKINKHCNKKKREKTRRLYSHLDQH